VAFQFTHFQSEDDRGGHSATRKQWVWFQTVQVMSTYQKSRLEYLRLNLRNIYSVRFRADAFLT